MKHKKGGVKVIVNDLIGMFFGLVCLAGLTLLLLFLYRRIKINNKINEKKQKLLYENFKKKEAEMIGIRIYKYILDFANRFNFLIFNIKAHEKNPEDSLTNELLKREGNELLIYNFEKLQLMNWLRSKDIALKDLEFDKIINEAPDKRLIYYIVKSEVLYNNPQTLDEYIKNFIEKVTNEIEHSDYFGYAHYKQEFLNAFYSLLKDNGIAFEKEKINFMEQHYIEDIEEKEKFITTDSYKYIKSFALKNREILLDYFNEPILSEKGSLFDFIEEDCPNYFEGENGDLSEIYKKADMCRISYWQREALRTGFYDEFRKLRELILLKAGVKFVKYLWESIIEGELSNNILDEVESKVFYNNPRNFNECVKNFLEIYGDNYNRYFQYFQIIITSKFRNLEDAEFSQINDELKKTGVVDAYKSINEIILKKIESIKKETELEHFAKTLESGNTNAVRITDVDLMTGQEFENFLKTLFERMGYKAMLTKFSNDQGADLIMNRLGEKVVVQAKRYSQKVSNNAIQEVVAAIKQYGVDRGIVVTNNEFTRSAIELAKSNNIELIDRIKLENLLKNFYDF